MAAIVRMVFRQGRSASNLIRQGPRIQCACSISTSKKNKDSVTSPTDIDKTAWPSQEAVVDEKHKNWISYGYNLTDKDDDEWAHNGYMFLGITLCFIGGVFVFAYQPDLGNFEWMQREAYLELARREAEGLPLVDGNLVPVDKIELPPEEELENVEIVI